MNDIFAKLLIGMALGCVIVSAMCACKEASDAVYEYRKARKETKKKEQELKDLKAQYGID